MASKVFDAVVTLRTYTNRAGEEKRVYQNVGTVFQNDKGQLSLQLERWFSPAGIPVNPERPDSGVWISFYEPKTRDDAPAPMPSPETNAPTPLATWQRKPTPAPSVDFDDDIPF